MHPAFSVIFLTTLIGVGQGLFLALFTAQSYALFDLLPKQDGHTFYAHGSAIALLFMAGGLVASFFHLGRPERARAISASTLPAMPPVTSTPREPASSGRTSDQLSGPIRPILRAAPEREVCSHPWPALPMSPR